MKPSSSVDLMIDHASGGSRFASMKLFVQTANAASRSNKVLSRSKSARPATHSVSPVGAFSIGVPRGFVPGVPTFASKESAWHGRDALGMVAGAWSDGYRQPGVATQSRRSAVTDRTEPPHRSCAPNHDV